MRENYEKDMYGKNSGKEEKKKRKGEWGNVNGSKEGYNGGRK